MKRWQCALLIGIPFVALLGGGAYVWRVTRAFSDHGQSLGEIWQGIKEPRKQFPADKSRITLLLIGKDYNYTNKDILYTKGARSDTIMLMSIDLDKKTMSAVSIPRDSHVIAPDHKEGKINGTFSRGGVKLLQKTLEKMFGIAIDYHVIIKDDAVKNIVNTLGGVDVETLDAMKYSDHWAGLNIDLPKGKQHVNGEQAVGFVRFREVKRLDLNQAGQIVPVAHVVPSLEEGDLRRTARQQQMIKAMMRSANSPGNMVRAGDIIETSFKQFDTNLTRLQMLGLATLMKGSDHNEILSATLPGKDVHMSWGMALDLDKPRSQATIDWLILGKEDRAKDTVKVSVYNGTTINGAAKVTAATLTKKGFLTTSQGNVGDVVDATTVVYHKTAFQPIAAQVAKIIGATKVIKQSTDVQDEASEIIVNIGLDYIPPPSAAKPVATTQKRNRRRAG